MNPGLKPHVIIIVQARMGSTRLPGKILKKVLGKPLLAYLMERLQRVQHAEAVVVATTTNPLDNPIIEFCNQQKLSYFRGSEEDVLERFYECAKHTHADIIVRITGDCPLIDPQVINQIIQQFLASYPSVDYISNVIKRTYPRGMDVEVFSFTSLEKVFKEAKKPEEREHVTPYYFRHPNLFKIENMAKETDESHFRWTVDTKEDFKLISLVLKHIYPANPGFTLEDLLQLFYKHPDWIEINAAVKQKEIG